jgi:hypothetical protein
MSGPDRQLLHALLVQPRGTVPEGLTGGTSTSPPGLFSLAVKATNGISVKEPPFLKILYLSPGRILLVKGFCPVQVAC